MELASGISAEKLAAKVGRRMRVLVDMVGEEGAIARSAADAPEIDGTVKILEVRPAQARRLGRRRDHRRRRLRPHREGRPRTLTRAPPATRRRPSAHPRNRLRCLSVRCTPCSPASRCSLPLAASGERVRPGATRRPRTAPAAAMDPLSEAIRERIDHLRYEIEHDHRDHAVRGERIVLGDTVARYYESQQFQPQWRDPARLGQLVDSIIELANDGLDPNDYHFEALDAYPRRAARREDAARRRAGRARDPRHRRHDARALPPLPRQGGPGEAELAVELRVAAGRRGARLRGDHAGARLRADPRDLRARAAAARLVPARTRAAEGVPRPRGGRRLADDPGRADDQAGDERSARAGAAVAAAVHPGPVGGVSPPAAPPQPRAAMPYSGRPARGRRMPHRAAGGNATTPSSRRR